MLESRRLRRRPVRAPVPDCFARRLRLARAGSLHEKPRLLPAVDRRAATAVPVDFAPEVRWHRGERKIRAPKWPRPNHRDRAAQGRDSKTLEPTEDQALSRSLVASRPPRIFSLRNKSLPSVGAKPGNPA